jgi:hypothetical protein
MHNPTLFPNHSFREQSGVFHKPDTELSQKTQLAQVLPMHHRSSRSSSDSIGSSSFDTTSVALRRQRPQKQHNVLKLGQSQRGTLYFGDKRDANAHYYDEFRLRNLRPGQQILISSKARGYDAGLRLFNARTNELLLESYWRSETDNSAHLYFTPEAGTRYKLQVISEKRMQVGAYRVRMSEFNNPDPTFNFFYGNGLVNSSAAVAQGIGTTPFPDIPDLGGDQWHLDMMNIPETWAQGYTGQNVVIAHIASGVDINHPDLQPNLWVNRREIAGNGIDDDGNGYIDDIYGWNFADSNNNLADLSPVGTGTHSAGLMVAANNGVGITGVAPDAKLMALQVSKADGNLPVLDRIPQAAIASAIRYAVDNGARVINLGVTYPIDTAIDTVMESALQYARQSGAVVVATSGGSRQAYSPNRPDHPAYFAAERDLAIVANGIDRHRNVSLSGNHAGFNRIDYVVAPGVDVLSTLPGGGYGLLRSCSRGGKRGWIGGSNTECQPLSIPRSNRGYTR